MRRRTSLMTLALAAAFGPATAPAAGPGADLGPIAPVAAEGGTGLQRKAALAHGDGVYLAAWQDGDETADVDGPATDIFCARIGPDGKPLDRKGIPVCKAKDYQLRPKVAFAGGVFLIVWEDYRNGTDGDIYAARVTPEGKVLDPEGFPVAAIAARNQVYAALASNGKDFLVAWMDHWAYPTYGIAMARVSPSGDVAPKDGALVIKEDDAKLKATAAKVRASRELVIPWTRPVNYGGLVGTVNFPDLIFVGDHYLCIMNTFGGLGRRLTRVPAAGPLRAEAGPESGMKINPERGFGHAFVAGPSQGWLYFRQDNLGRGQSEKNFFTVVVQPDGSLPKPNGNGDSATVASGGDERKIVDLNTAGAFDGRQYWLAFEAKAGVALGRIDPQGKASGIEFAGDKAKGQFMLATGEGCTHPALASDGKGGVMAVWTDDAGIGDARLKCRAIKGGKGGE